MPKAARPRRQPNRITRRPAQDGRNHKPSSNTNTAPRAATQASGTLGPASDQATVQPSPGTVINPQAERNKSKPRPTWMPRTTAAGKRLASQRAAPVNDDTRNMPATHQAAAVITGDDRFSARDVGPSPCSGRSASDRLPVQALRKAPRPMTKKALV